MFRRNQPENPLAKRVRAADEPATLDLDLSAEVPATDEPPTRDLAAGEESISGTNLVCAVLVALDGPEKGALKQIFEGENHFDDGSVNVTYDAVMRTFQIIQAGVKRDLQSGECLMEGGFSYRFVPICGPDFAWEDQADPTG